ncbi:class I SAM-dependent methyltransferase [Streptomyces cavernae]|uniref:class I SAM-dependent methyltransferase n=1 Tax=Streptomyces cavernae TaxID=2259034 RepID=UPI000FEBA6BC|nr:class I SAM-dependent methyltransferase [Streptomyces cavernae]
MVDTGRSVHSDGRLAEPWLAPGKDWDAVADLRFEQIESGADISYRRVLVPAIENLLTDLPGLSAANVVDVGCGTGYLTGILAKSAEHVDATDPSFQSIAIARAKHSASNIRYYQQEIESFGAPARRGRYQIAVANMVLMCVSDLTATLRSVAELLAPGGRLVATIPHPAHWAAYAGYLDKPWYDPRAELESQIRVAWRYRVSTDDREGSEVVHYLRSMTSYSRALESNGMGIEKIRELFPDAETEKMYPERWEFPRYLAFQAKRQS